ncbi:unnamed protein product [Ceutorhynchus assimilis]|uniref:N-acetylneuraminate lyase n=1 Tax=Ceutorhynchus assimilis TaxID=467358 RepID=A0A9N9MKT7_9CUCU|nr:unnamed protein product [Ceutorhynchus assimilis]
MATFTYRGLMAPVFTAFNKDWSVNTKVIPTYAKFLADRGLTSVLVHGSTGEGPALSVAERKTITEAWVAAAKTTKQHVMIQVGGCPLPDVLELAKHAEQVGADSILCLPELYFKANTAQELIDYLKNVAAAAPNTPLLYYHIPMWSGVHVNMEQFLNLSVGQIPSFHGIKYTSNDLSEAYNALKAADGRYAVFLGADTLVQPAFALGFDSVIATGLNFLPEHFVKLVALVKENKIVEARNVQAKITAAVKAVSKHGHWIPTMKVAMNSFTSVDVGLAREPLKNLTQEQVKQIQTEVKQYV